MIAFDLAPSSLRNGFATNLNVVTERTALPLAVVASGGVEAARAGRLRRPADLVADGDAAGGQGRTPQYKARFNVGGKRLVTAMTQYALVRTGAAVILTYTTLPKLAKAYRARFERSARSLRF